MKNIAQVEGNLTKRVLIPNRDDTGYLALYFKKINSSEIEIGFKNIESSISTFSSILTGVGNVNKKLDKLKPVSKFRSKWTTMSIKKLS
jgi:hypothetical protein